MNHYSSICIKEQVGFFGDKTLDQILKGTPIPKNFDLLSIDIDGNDYFVWQALATYQPKVVIIEMNAHFRPGELKINDPSRDFELFLSGSSISALTQLAHQKGYSLVSVVGCNAIFILQEYLSIFHKKRLSEFDVFSFEAFSSRDLDLHARLQRFLFSIAKPNLLARASRAARRRVL
jgi:hypothetical protein